MWRRLNSRKFEIGQQFVRQDNVVANRCNSPESMGEDSGILNSECILMDGRVD